MERISSTELTLVGATPQDLDLRILASYKRWTVIITPIDSGPSDPVTLDVSYEVGGGAFAPRNPPNAPATLVLNRANIITSEDVVNKIRLSFVPGVTAPDGVVKVVLNGAR